MPTFKEGDRVRVLTREQTEDDQKTQLYFPHYAGMVGAVQKVYGKDEVAVEIDAESLSRELRQRHEDVRSQMKTKWLDGLSEEGRGRLTEREKDFHLRYVVLVRMADLEKGPARATPEPKPIPALASGDSQAAHASSPPPNESPPAPRRRTLEEIEADEQAELERRANS